MSKPVLIIEDDPDIAESVRYNLEAEGFAATIASTGEQGFALALDNQNPASVIILDLMLPGISGTELCRRLRRENQTRRTPIIMLTAKTSEADRVAGLDLGADDYIAKPFSVRELVARVRAVLRRIEEDATERYDDGRLTIDFADIRAVCEGASGSNCWIKCGATVITATRARLTFTFDVCARSLVLVATALKQSYGSAIALSVAVPDLRSRVIRKDDQICFSARFIQCFDCGVPSYFCPFSGTPRIVCDYRSGGHRRNYYRNSCRSKIRSGQRARANPEKPRRRERDTLFSHIA